MDGNLQRLRELTDRLDLSNFTPSTQIGDTYHYDFGGEAITHGLAHTPEVAMARLEMKAGTTFPEHSHTMLEVFVVLKGEIFFNMAGEDWTLTAGHPFYTLPNVPHGGKAVKDSTILVMTIPADPSYPKPEGG